MNKKKLIKSLNLALNDVWKSIRGLHKDIHDTQGDIPATVELKQLGEGDYWHFEIKGAEEGHYCSVKGNLSMILHMGVCFRKIYDWDERKKECPHGTLGGFDSCMACRPELMEEKEEKRKKRVEEDDARKEKG